MLDWLIPRSPWAKPREEAQVCSNLITGQDGLTSGTHVISNLGWRPVDGLAVGDKVLTFDRGMQQVIDIHREVHFASEHSPHIEQWPLRVPADALCNRRELFLMPGQGVLIECDIVEDAQGDPYAVVPAYVMEGYRGIRPIKPTTGVETTTLIFESDEVIYAEGGMMIHCPRALDLLSRPSDGVDVAYLSLHGDNARSLIDHMIAIEHSQAVAGLGRAG